MTVNLLTTTTTTTLLYRDTSKLLGKKYEKLINVKKKCGKKV